MQFIQTARELKQHTLTVVKKCPKRLQFFLLGPIYEEAREVLHSVKAANNTYVHNQHEAQIRADYLGRANVVLQNLADDLEDLYEELLSGEERYKWVPHGTGCVSSYKWNYEHLTGGRIPVQFTVCKR